MTDTITNFHSDQLTVHWSIHDSRREDGRANAAVLARSGNKTFLFIDRTKDEIVNILREHAFSDLRRGASVSQRLPTIDPREPIYAVVVHFEDYVVIDWDKDLSEANRSKHEQNTRS